jgi:hypothetical protein
MCQDLTLNVCILNCNTFLREVIATMNSNESKERQGVMSFVGLVCICSHSMDNNT